MVRSKLGLKALGLCALVLGLMAFASSAAQAESGAHWNVAGTAVTGATAVQTEIKELEGNSATLLFTTKSGTKVGILCTTAKFDGGGALIKEGGVSLGRVEFKGCVTFLNGEPSLPCKPKTAGKALGEILSERGTGLIVLDAGEDYVKITPENAKGETAKLFARLEMGLECSIGEIVNVEAKELGQGLWIKDCLGNTGFTKEATTHLIEESLHQLIALGQPATIDGSAVIGLETGQLFSGTPG
jgi:hypothetical protein